MPVRGWLTRGPVRGRVAEHVRPVGPPRRRELRDSLAGQGDIRRQRGAAAGVTTIVARAHRRAPAAGCQTGSQPDVASRHRLSDRGTRLSERQAQPDTDAARAAASYRSVKCTCLKRYTLRGRR